MMGVSAQVRSDALRASHVGGDPPGRAFGALSSSERWQAWRVWAYLPVGVCLPGFQAPKPHPRLCSCQAQTWAWLGERP
jgi:hypothetical protein